MSSPIRLVVSDVDGTLVDPDKTLRAATIAAVRRLEAAGVGFTIISARPRSGLMALIETLGVDAPVGAFNGGTVFRRDGTIEARFRVPEAVVREALAAARDVAVDIWVFAADRWYASNPEGEHVGHERVASAQEPVITTDFDTLVGEVDKITFVSDDPPVLKALHERIAAVHGDDATIAQSQSYYLDITAWQANKGEGIASLAKAFDVELAEVAAIGDQANDLPMLLRAGLPIVMGNAPSAVKAQVATHTLSNAEDGVAHAIETIIFPRTGVRT